MKRRKPVLVFGAVFLALLFLAVAAFARELHTRQAQEGEANEAVEGRNDQSARELSPDETILAFAETLYTYDTRERKFYEGAEKFMTRQAYEGLAPAPEGEADGPVAQMTSRLQEISIYTHGVDEGSMEAMAEIWYRLSGVGESSVRQIVKIALHKNGAGGWKISACEVLDTMEQ